MSYEQKITFYLISRKTFNVYKYVGLNLNRYMLFLIYTFMKHLKTYENFRLNESNSNYNRVIPRDLFNESKLLKCIGRLCLLIHDNNTPVDMSADNDGDAFEIVQLQDGSLSVSNVNISIKGQLHIFATTYNSKANYPLVVITQDDAKYRVFDENGEYETEFIEYCNNLETKVLETFTPKNISKRVTDTKTKNILVYDRKETYIINNTNNKLSLIYNNIYADSWYLWLGDLWDENNAGVTEEKMFTLLISTDFSKIKIEYVKNLDMSISETEKLCRQIANEVVSDLQHLEKMELNVYNLSDKLYTLILKTFNH